MKMLALISAMMIFFAFALQNAVKDMTYSHQSSQVQKLKKTGNYKLEDGNLKAFKTAETKIVAVK
jgi:hypothetical protein